MKKIIVVGATGRLGRVIVGLGTIIFALGIGPSVALGITIVGGLSKKV